jgi:adenosine deaminase CECR1
MVGNPTMNLFCWKQLALWSIEYSCLNDHQKEEGYRIFQHDWQVFCENIVRDYSKIAEDIDIMVQ